ncbi:hypothetical protein N7493_010957 [Penicillium malachiteum]|uniref:NADH dehydrogenase [ubiquinone] 1 alpha subcomplex subunit 13 n=1 Tax=Penicillium malachiteum TaxID=1324776 RepID=A0AAD6MQM8_9EURO|nr:hypothetical protein N7493_010957 [Penicillium malachiteum]
MIMLPALITLPAHVTTVTRSTSPFLDFTLVCEPQYPPHSRHNASGYAPNGGYAQVQYKRNLPARGFKPWVYMVGMHAIMAYGFYRYFGGVREQRYVFRAASSDPFHLTSIHITPQSTNLSQLRSLRELAREKMWARLYLTPLLQAEEDRDQVRRYYADKERANKLFGNDEKVYNSDRFVRPTFAYTPGQMTQ